MHVRHIAKTFAAGSVSGSTRSAEDDLAIYFGLPISTNQLSCLSKG